MKSGKCYKFCISIIKLPRNFAIINQEIMIMAVHIGDNKLAITAEPKTFYIKDIEKYLKYEVEFFIKHNESLAEY